jgi:outer membrane protein assembly factor BamB
VVGLALVALVVTLATGLAGASTTDQTRGQVDIDTSDLPGNGTTADPYVVTNASELQAIEDDIDANYTLGADIDASGTATWNNGSGFDPVATTPFFGGTGFSGSFDGAGHTITGLTIDRASEYVGLFGGLAAEGRVENVTVADAAIDGERAVAGVVGSNGGLVRGVTVSGMINGSRSVGGVAGESDSARVHDSTAAVTVTGSKNIGGLVGSQAVGATIEESRATGTVTGWKNVGGLVGKQSLNADTESSIATATVDGSIAVGGLVGGALGGAVRNSSAGGDVNGSWAVGGLVGGNSAPITRSYATARVNGSEGVGGLVGQNRFDDAAVSRSYAAGRVTGANLTGGLVGESVGSGGTASGYWDTEATGQTTSAGGTPLVTAEMTGAAAPGNMTALAFPAAWQTRAGDYPGLDWQVNDVPVPEINASRWVLAGTPVTLDANGSDDDRAIARYEWDVDGDNQTEYTGERVTHAFTESGNRTVTLRATDSAGATGVATATVRVVANRSLAVSVAAPDSVAVGGTVSLSLSLDRSGTKLTDVAWDTNGDNATERTGTSVRTLFESGGTQTVSATATDIVGRQATRAVEIRVTGDEDDLIGGHHRFRVDRASTGNSTEVGPVSDISVDWTYGVGSRVFASPVVADGIVYTASYSTSRGDRIVAVSARDGKRLWQFRTTEPVGGNPTVANGTLYVASDAGVLYALDARTGAKEWSRGTGTVGASPVVVNDTLYVPGGSTLYALDPETGEIVFTTQAGGGSSPAVADGTVYVGGGGSITAIDAETGTREWTFTEPGGRVESAPAVVNGTVYAGSHDDSLYAVDAATGTENWAFQTGDIVRSSPAVADGTVYVGSDDGFVYAVDAATGAEEWAFETSAESIFGEPDNRVSSSPVVASNTVYIGNDGYYVYALNATDGTERWSYVTNFDVGATPAVADGQVYAGSVDGTLYALSGSVPVGDAPPPVVGETRPQDSDDDGLYEDVRGDGEFNILDVQSLFNNLDDPPLQSNGQFFFFQQRETPQEVTILDVQELFNEL